MAAEHSRIEFSRLAISQKEINSNEHASFQVAFAIGGNIRQVFDQSNWERAYNLHDTLFRIKIDIDLKSGFRDLTHTSILHKASLFWTRNPKLSYRIWVLVVKDDATFYPSTIEEAKSLLFDVEKELILDASHFKPGRHKVHASIRTWWGKHYYTPSCVLSSKTNDVLLHRAG